MEWSPDRFIPPPDQMGVLPMTQGEFGITVKGCRQEGPLTEEQNTEIASRKIMADLSTIISIINLKYKNLYNQRENERVGKK